MQGLVTGQENPIALGVTLAKKLSTKGGYAKD